jgi:GNAT superfamily N-acetyltransferase
MTSEDKLENLSFIAISEDFDDFDDHEDLQIMNYVDRDLDALVAESGLGITSDRDLDLVVFDTKEEKIVAAAWISFCPSDENYEFDVIVSKDYQGIGLGKKLTKDYIDKYDEYKEIYEDATMNLHVVNEKMNYMLKSLGFGIQQTLSIENWIMKKTEETPLSKNTSKLD